jgi:putative ABC transport system permease protein
MTLLRFAARNVSRNLRRSASIVLAMAAGLVVLVFLKGVTDGYVDEQLEAALGRSAGHVVVHSATSGAIVDGGAAARRLAADVRVVAASPRIRLEAFARTDAGTAGVAVLGVDAAAESRTSWVPRSLVAGEFLPDAAPREAPPAVLGEGLAMRLAAATDDRVTLLVEGRDGALVADVFRVAGVFRTGDRAFDGSVVYVPRDVARTMLLLDGDATEVVARVRDPLRAGEIASAADAAMSSDGLRVESWREAVPEVRQAMETLHAVELLRSATLFLLVGLGIFNTVMMSLYERRRELGVLAAVGMRPGAIFRCLVLEVAILAAHALALGLAVGVAVTQTWLGSRGLDLSALGARLLPGSGVIHPVVRADNLIAAAAWVAAISVAVLVLPAWRLLRLDPAQALRDR